MDAFFWLCGVGWGVSGFVAVCRAGCPGMWRVAIFMGPLAFLAFQPRE